MCVYVQAKLSQFITLIYSYDFQEKEAEAAALAGDDDEDTTDNNGDSKTKKKKKKDSKEFRAAFFRLLKNKLFMYNFFSGIFYVFAFMGFGTFMPKFVEYNFRVKGSASSSYAGAVGTVSKALGLLVSGWLISKFKPSARFLSG